MTSSSVPALPTSDPLPVNLPSLPGACLQVIHATDDDDVQIDEVVRLIAADPVLTAELLRVANSAAYVRREAVVTIRSAVVVLGLRVVRRVALSFVLRTTSDSGNMPPMMIEQFWRQALVRATACEHLARPNNLDPDEAFLVGLLQDVGFLLLFAAHPARQPMWPWLVALSPDMRLDVERELFGSTHTDAFARAAKAWALPPALVKPIVTHHEPAAGEDRDGRMARIARVSDVVAATLARQELMRSRDDLRASLASVGIPAAEFDKHLEEIPRQAEAAATALGMKLAPATSYDAVLRAAFREMSTLTERQIAKVQELQRQLEAREAVASRLDQERADLRRKAYTDPLTSVGNRRSFDESLANLVLKAIQEREPFSIITLDIDHFKAINDRYGHPFGDTVLQAVANTLLRSTRSSDHRARIGGEEFAVLLYGAPKSAGQRIADTLRVAVEALRIEHEGAPVPVTISVGGQTITPETSLVQQPAALMSRVLREADVALYTSKTRGRNCVTWADAALPAPST